MVTSWCLLYAICLVGVLIPLSVKAAKRSDDPVALSAVEQQLVDTVNDLKARNTALETKVSLLEAKVAAMKCKSGVLTFKPHEQDLITHPDGFVERKHTLHVAFSPPFANVPEVTSGLTHIDSDNHSSADRISVEISNVSTTGFDVSVQEWLDTHNFDVNVSWMACSV